MKKELSIYTDGACSGNPGPGGWGAVMLYKGNVKEIQGNSPCTTNNRMELSAVIEALKVVKLPSKIQIYTDSSYVNNGLNLWFTKWSANGWRTAANKPVKNQDLWVELWALMQPHEVTCNWVKGHSDNVYNQRADALARQACAGRHQS